MLMATQKKTRRTLVSEIKDDDALAELIGKRGFVGIADLARATTLTYWTVNKAINHKARISPTTAHAIADALQVDYDDYFTTRWYGGVAKDEKEED